MEITAAQLLEWSHQGSTPQQLLEASDRVHREFCWYQQAIATSGRHIYGATTMTGHLDARNLSAQDVDRLQALILETHHIGSAPYFDDAEARLIGYAKAVAVATGGTGLSREVYVHLLHCLADEHFRPRIPSAASYSCGDVIPGAHWARAMLDHDDFSHAHPLRPGEALGLINGVFVDLGTSVALLPPLRACIGDMLINARLAARCFGQSRAEFLQPARTASHALPAMAFVIGDMPRESSGHGQAPVSLRATPELVDVVLSCYRSLVETLDSHLSHGSANPFVSMEAGQVLSQASFMSPVLSVTKSAACESILFAMWACQSRILAIAARLEAEMPAGMGNMAIVQVPKLAQAVLEDARMGAGRRAFASGGATSQGIEDLWSHGVSLTTQLKSLLHAWRRLEGAQYRLLRILAGDQAGDRERRLDGLRHDPVSARGEASVEGNWELEIDAILDGLHGRSDDDS